MEQEGQKGEKKTLGQKRTTQEGSGVAELTFCSQWFGIEDEQQAYGEEWVLLQGNGERLLQGNGERLLQGNGERLLQGMSCIGREGENDTIFLVVLVVWLEFLRCEAIRF